MSWKNALEGCPHSVLHDCRRVPWKEGFTGVSQKRGFKQCFAAASHKWVPQRTLKRICYTDLLWCAFGFMDKCKHIWFPPHPKQVDPQTCDPGWHGSFHNKRTGMSQPASALDRFLAKLIQLQWQPLTTGSKWSMRHDRPPGCTTNKWRKVLQKYQNDRTLDIVVIDYSVTANDASHAKSGAATIYAYLQDWKRPPALLFVETFSWPVMHLLMNGSTPCGLVANFASSDPFYGAAKAFRLPLLSYPDMVCQMPPLNRSTRMIGKEMEIPMESVALMLLIKTLEICILVNQMLGLFASYTLR